MTSIARLTCLGSAAEENERIAELLSQPIDQVYQLHWHYNKTSIALGRSQKVTDDMKQRAKTDQAEVFQRLSGGGAVLTSSNLLSVTTIIPIAHPLAKLDLIQCFKKVGGFWQMALGKLGVKSELCDTVDKGPNDLQWICYAGASHGELFDSKGRKLLGLAQTRKRYGIAVMMGIYDQPIDWQTLFAVVRGDIEASAINQISQMTTSASEQGLVLSDNIRRQLINYFSACF